MDAYRKAGDRQSDYGQGSRSGHCGGIRLPRGTTLIQIRIGLDEAVKVICRYYPDEEAGLKLYEVFQRYHVVPADDVGVGRPPGASMRLPVTHTVD